MYYFFFCLGGRGHILHFFMYDKQSTIHVYPVKIWLYIHPKNIKFPSRWFIDCLLFYFLLKNGYNSDGDITIADEGLQNLGICSTSLDYEQAGNL